MKETFERWRFLVDQQVQHIVGLSADDLPDAPYRDWYDDGMTHRQAARKAVKAAREG